MILTGRRRKAKVLGGEILPGAQAGGSLLYKELGLNSLDWLVIKRLVEHKLGFKPFRSKEVLLERSF